MINIEKLHHAVEHINSGVRTQCSGAPWVKPGTRRIASPMHIRPLGVSTAYVELMLAEVMLGDPDNKYLYIGENLRMAEIAINNLYKRLVQEKVGVHVRQLSYLQLDTGQTFRAVGIQQITNYNVLRGHSFDRVFCDVDLRLRSVDFVTRFKGELFPSLISREGDMV